MFDFRYHVASLAAVFLALVLGILVGVGLSGRGFVDDAERTRLNRAIDDLELERDAARKQLDDAEQVRSSMGEYAEKTYPLLVPGRLHEKRVALLFAGSVDPAVNFAVRQAVRDAGGTVVRMRAVKEPVDEEDVRSALERADLREYLASGTYEALGRDLGEEFTKGGRSPLWEALSDVLVEQRSGDDAGRTDAVVVARSELPGSPPTRELVDGLLRGVARSGVPAVGVQLVDPAVPGVPAFRRAGLSTVDSVETPPGGLALVALLAGAKPGHYGTGPRASDGVLPPVEPLPAAP